MTPYELVLFAGAMGTFVIIWQNWLSFRDTRVELENRLRERMKGRGNTVGRVAATVDEIRIYELSRVAKLKWYLGRGINSSVEVKVEMNASLDEEVWDAIEELFDPAKTAFPEVEYLGTMEVSGAQTVHSVLRIDSTDESEIMSVVSAIPMALDEMDLQFELAQSQSPTPFDIPDEFAEEFEEMM
ncbi:hypothetical protein C440_04923 [Haloferax mucosum ATCC BAA-1512]|uniref:Uncharacterized protein n=1 Tax=Haloferax mucosum ATCC BAA-1512 TaxID=662479 RepID=M0IKA4_9EURY|nr:hypothetical protein [Haloferax mucosum]ELZ96462.1 hypothetical protein C440_04923 [Haloferax mucosum ATCC BAA-1512]